MAKHLAILRQPFLNLILSGEKTVETRWSKNKIAPYKQVSTGDLIFLKETGKDCFHTAIVDKVEFYELTPKVAEEIKQNYGSQICVSKFTNWKDVSNRNYVSLMWLTCIKKSEPVKFKSYGGSGWIVIEK